MRWCAAWCAERFHDHRSGCTLTKPTSQDGHIGGKDFTRTTSLSWNMGGRVDHVRLNTSHKTTNQVKFDLWGCSQKPLPNSMGQPNSMGKALSVTPNRTNIKIKRTRHSQVWFVWNQISVFFLHWIGTWKWWQLCQFWVQRGDEGTAGKFSGYRYLLTSAWTPDGAQASPSAISRSACSVLDHGG